MGGDGGGELLRVLLLQMKCQQLDMFPQEPLATEKTEGVPIWRGGGGDGTRQGGRAT